MKQLSTIELYKERMKFSAAHFTIFSAKHRENLHGHNYNVYLSLDVLVGDEGLSFDYRYYKNKIYELCEELDQYTLLPQNSKFLKIEEDEKHIYTYFDQEKLSFLKRDVKILPISNSTLEELSKWFIQRLSEDHPQLENHQIESMTVKVFSGPGQSGSCRWRKPS